MLRLCAAVLLLLAAQDGPRATNALARLWDAEHVSSPLSPLVDHAEVSGRIATLDPMFRVEQVGTSMEGRSISSVSVGRGPFVVMLWSQMHGDEATATSALFDLYEYIRLHRAEPTVARLLESLTVHTVPMLNPDGAERWQRRNVQGIDLNRDALLLQSAEGQLLKRLRDRWEPKVGFNLHNQNWRTSVGSPPKGAAISLLSVAYDEPRTVNDGRLLTKKLAAVVRDALEPLAQGRIGRYDDTFEVRAFGDNLTKWGTPVLLIETGPWPDVNPDPMLVRLNYIALIRALHALADGSVQRADPARYDTLPENDSQNLYVIVSNVTIVQGSGLAPFTGDVGINATRGVRRENGARKLVLSSTIDDLGDLRTSGALFPVDGTGLTLAPLMDQAREGDEIDLPQWTAEAPSLRLVLPGRPADLMLLAKQASGRYKVVRIFRAVQELS